jgi:hypothetical protein
MILDQAERGASDSSHDTNAGHTPLKVHVRI